ncbi:HK97 family phage prohead protease [Acinetobacter sp.]|jgi:HK97 family phage prohead protease|uniref:HK97 family phage prohead protease n=1 Tax=Acinetobacter sp. TaxID=472 RepID=UPI003BAE1A5C
MNREALRHELKMLLARNHKNLPNVEMRFVPFQDLEIRVEADQDPNKPFRFEGYAVKWDSVNSHGEKFQQGAFSDYINAVKVGTQRCHMYYNHGWSLVYINPKFAMRTGKWVELEEDDIGLKVVGEVTPGMSLSNDMEAMIKHGTIDGLSIAFHAPADMDVEYFDDHVLIKRVGLYEISVCDEPSDRNARLSDTDLRNIETEEDLKKYLKRFNLDDAMADQLIQRVQTLGQPPEPKKDPLAALAWVQ